MNITNVATLVFAIGSIAGLLNLWLKEDQKSNVREYLARVKTTTTNNPAEAIKIPLQLLFVLISGIFKTEVGNNLHWSRFIIVSTLFLFMSLGVAGLITNTTFGFNKPLWEMYESDIRGLKVAIESREKSRFDEAMIDTPDYTEEEWLEAKAELIPVFDKLLQPKWAVIYTIYVLLIVIGINIVADYYAFRWMMSTIKAMLNTDSAFLLAGAVLLSFYIAVFIAILSIGILFLLTSPFMYLFYMLGFAKYSEFLVAMFAVSLLLSVLFKLYWIIGVAVSIIIPILIIFFMALVTLCLYPMRTVIGKGAVAIIERALEYKHGPLAFFASFLILIAAMIRMILEPLANWLN